MRYSDLWICRARGGPQKTEGYLVAYVGNLPFDSTEDSIKGIFEVCKRGLVY